MNEHLIKLLEYALQHRNELEREARLQRQLASLKPRFRVRLALWLSELAVRLEPDLESYLRKKVG